MRIAVVTPYSWTYEGGVNRHAQALAEQLIESGNEVRVLAPWDPPDRLSRTLHRGAAPRIRPMPDYLTTLGRTVGFGANGAVSNLSIFPDAISTMRRELRGGNFDVVHVQEPPAPILGWDASGFGGAPVVGTFHAYSTKFAPQQCRDPPRDARRKFNQLSGRIAVSEAADGPVVAGSAATTRSSPTASTSGSPRPTARAGDRGGAAAALRRPRRGAQGPAGPAARLRGARRARARRASSSSGRLATTSPARSPIPRRWGRSTRSARSTAIDSGRSWRPRTRSARLRCRARASAWS